MVDGTIRKFRVRVSLKKRSGHHMRQIVFDSTEMVLEREFEIFAKGDDDAKVRAKALPAKKGYDEKLLKHASWTVSQLDYQLKD